MKFRGRFSPQHIVEGLLNSRPREIAIIAGFAFSGPPRATGEVVVFFLFFVFLSDFVKNGAPHGNAVNSSKNEGPAYRKSRKKRPETEGKTVGKRRRKNNGSCVDVCSILGGFGEPFWESTCFKKQGEI